MIPWRLRLWVDGIGTLQIEDDDDSANTNATGPWIGDGLAYTRTIDDALWPAQSRRELTFQIVANTAAELAAVDMSASCGMVWNAARQSNVPRYRFVGQITSWIIRPHPRGAIATARATGYVHAYLSNDPTGGTSWPIEAKSVRLGRLLDLPYAFDVAPTHDPDVVARDGSRSNALDLVLPLLESWANNLGAGTGWVARFEIDADDYGLDDVVTLDVDGAFLRGWILRRIRKVPVPGGEKRIDASRVEFGPSWDQRPDLTPTAITAAGKPAGADYSTTVFNTLSKPRVNRSFDTDLNGSGPIDRVASLYLPEAGTSPWHLDTLIWRLDQEETFETVPNVGDYVTLVGVPAEWTPTGLTQYTGVLAEFVFQVDKGRPRVAMKLRPTVTTISLIQDGGDSNDVVDLILDGGDSTTPANGPLVIIDGGSST